MSDKREKIKSNVIQAFKLLEEVGVDIGGCGCCGSPFLEISGHHKDFEMIVVDSDEEYIEKVLNDMGVK